MKIFFWTGNFDKTVFNIKHKLDVKNMENQTQVNNLLSSKLSCSGSKHTLEVCIITALAFQTIYIQPKSDE